MGVAVSGEEMNNNDPPRHHCNPLAPFCTDHPKREDAAEGQGECMS